MIRDFKDNNDNWMDSYDKLFDPYTALERTLNEMDAAVALMMLRRQNPVRDTRIKSNNESRPESVQPTPPESVQPTPPPSADNSLTTTSITTSNDNSSLLLNVPLNETPEERLNIIAAIETPNVPIMPTKYPFGIVKRCVAPEERFNTIATIEIPNVSYTLTKRSYGIVKRRVARKSRKTRQSRKTRKTWTQRVSRKSLLKACRNMIFEFLDRDDLI